LEKVVTSNWLMDWQPACGWPRYKLGGSWGCWESLDPARTSTKSLVPIQQAASASFPTPRFVFSPPVKLLLSGGGEWNNMVGLHMEAKWETVRAAQLLPTHISFQAAIASARCLLPSSKVSFCLPRPVASIVVLNWAKDPKWLFVEMGCCTTYGAWMQARVLFPAPSFAVKDFYSCPWSRSRESSFFSPPIAIVSELSTHIGLVQQKGAQTMSSPRDQVSDFISAGTRRSAPTLRPRESSRWLRSEV